MKDIVLYSIAFFAVIFIVIYGLKLLQNISGQHKLVHEYYYENITTSIPIDFIIIGIYILIGLYIHKHIKALKSIKKSVVIFVTSLIITTMFYLYYINQNSNSFFTRWFKTTGLVIPALYDATICTSVFLVFSFLKKETT